jgi:hypothetical protein
VCIIPGRDAKQLARCLSVSTALVLAQQYLPARISFSSGLTLALCSGAGTLWSLPCGPPVL